MAVAMKKPPPGHAITAAKKAGLRYVNPDDRGITRTRSGRAFSYHGPTGKRIVNPATLGRIKRLAVPPAWTEVWICPRDDGHIQAHGRDARGRKQYRYHPDWRATRDETKYERTLEFGRALPRIRRRVARDLKRRGLGREKVLATILRLLETTLFRVGNDEYARDNASFGLSTMRDRHVEVKGSRVRFTFKGKSGKHVDLELSDPRVARIVRQAQDLPGQELFQYLGDDGAVHDLKSDDVNDYLREIAGREFSAKDFRTWAGTVLAAIALQQFRRFDSKAEAKQNVVNAIERVAERLGNTPSVCRKCYIHPVVLDSYLAGATVAAIRGRAREELGRGLAGLSGAEGAVLAFLEQRLRQKQPALLTSLRRSVAQPRRPRRAGARGGISGGARAAARSRRRRSQSSARRR